MAEHTRGPWRVEKNPDDGITDPAVMAGKYYVATVHDACSSEGCWDADACLIAAAPELLAALERTLNWLASYPGQAAIGPGGPYDQARAAIAKAKGAE